MTPAAKAAIRKANPDGINRAARARTCGRCHRPVFVGLDADMAAMNVRVDAYPLSALGELQAVMSGRRTYELTWFGGRGRYEINPRDAVDIAGSPPGADVNTDVVVTHECGTDRLPDGPAVDRRTKRNETPIDPPF